MRDRYPSSQHAGSWSLLLLIALSVWLATSVLAVPPRASESPAALLLTSDAMVLAPGSSQARITAVVRDANGAPLAGVPVAFTSDHGSLAPTQATTNGEGVAESVFTAGSQTSRARVLASAGSLSQELFVQVAGPDSAARHGFDLDAEPPTLAPGQQIAVVVVLTDETGVPVSGAPVTLFGARGELTPASAITDAQGRIAATFTAGLAAGEARITALAGRGSATTTLRIEGGGGSNTPSPTPPSSEPGNSETEPTILLPLVLR